MHLWSISPLDIDHIDEICEDLRLQQETGVSTCALFIMYFTPEGTPPWEKAKFYCEKYDRFREKLDKTGTKHGVLVQSTLGHITPPNESHPFQTVIATAEDGAPYEGVCCPMDPGFRAYIREQMRILAEHHPSVIMIDDDVGLLYRGAKGCSCPHHLSEFNRRAGTQMIREELYAHLCGTTEEDRRLTQIYLDVQRDGLVGAVEAMREGIDAVDPTIQGACSSAAAFCEFTEDIAAAIAGKGNPRIARYNNGNYTPAGARWFSKNMLRAAIQAEVLEGKIDVFLAETDTCPQNRYSTGAMSLHAHMTGTILEGAAGAKHWITRLSAHEPNSGKAYRQVLAKYHGFYEALHRLTPQIQPFGCRIPLSKVRDYRLDKPSWPIPLVSPWASCVLERMGFPLYFSGKSGGAVFLDDEAPAKFTDEQLLDFFRGTVILSAKAAQTVNERGFSAYTGVEVTPWQGPRASTEILRINGNRTNVQVDAQQLRPLSDAVIVDSDVIHISSLTTSETLFPGSTKFKNPLGGTTCVFCGTPDTPFSYAKAFSFLNESRKRQFTAILKETGNLPLYYPGDLEIYLRAGYLPDRTVFAAIFNISLDPLEKITLVCDFPVNRVEKLTPEGNRVPCAFTQEGDRLILEESAEILTPVILFLS